MLPSQSRSWFTAKFVFNQRWNFNAVTAILLVAGIVGNIRNYIYTGKTGIKVNIFCAQIQWKLVRNNEGKNLYDKSLKIKITVEIFHVLFTIILQKCWKRRPQRLKQKLARKTKSKTNFWIVLCCDEMSTRYVFFIIVKQLHRNSCRQNKPSVPGTTAITVRNQTRCTSCVWPTAKA